MGCVFETAIRNRGKAEPIDLNERYRMQNLYLAEPVGSLNKALTYSLLVRTSFRAADRPQSFAFGEQVDRQAPTIRDDKIQ